ncbi:beta-galactosidase [Dictyobacter kobayashii]|uniref:Glycoside hydrolase family 42 N-terminal domain-containing protein n=1 Tax=Dictyobacter kobayashii TaxID=2014872 RepID=A0A402AVE6_9CHLR|nr:beta-galactosidase [Dictyobacter kobayashii]GCE22983.1 hypothetical protein KDK_67830 [Dictyobacter kobayashii]
MDSSFFDKKLYGTTFSEPHFKELGLDWKQCLDYMQTALPAEFSFLRVGAYWSQIQPTADTYVWDTLDAVIDAIEQKGRYSILLSVGMKAPRYPEYYIPAWAMPVPTPGMNSEISLDPTLRIRVLDFIGKTVDRYRGRDIIKAWQVENEPMDRAGDAKWFIGADFVAEEAARVRSQDSRPLVINCWCEDQTLSSYPWGLDGDYAVRNALAIADVLALDIYPTVNGSQLDYTNRCQVLPRAYLRRAIDVGKHAMVGESQAEPWGPEAPTPADIRWLNDQHIGQGYHAVLLWGLEWWYSLAVKQNLTIMDHIVWETERFAALSRIAPEWTTSYATNLTQHQGKLYLTVIGNENAIWLFSSPDDGQTWNLGQVPQTGWVTGSPVGMTSHNGRLYMTIVGNNQEAWLLSSTDEGRSWNTTQVEGNWQTGYQMNMASLNGVLYLTLVGNTRNEAYLLTSNDNGASFNASQILGDWQTQQPLGIAAHNGNIYITLVGLDSAIWLIKYVIANQTYYPIQVYGNENWQTQFPVGITSHDGALFLAVTGQQRSEVLLLSTTDDGAHWDLDSGFFNTWTTQNSIALANFVDASNQQHLHLSLVGSTEGEIYLCTKNPRIQAAAFRLNK